MKFEKPVQLAVCDYWRDEFTSETWTLQKVDIRRLEAFEIWIWRRMMKVPWTEHKTNEEILKMVETERKIMDTVRSRRKRWLGHILRHDSLLRITLEGQIQGKKAYGRPRTMLLDWLLKTEEGNISYEELKMSTQDRSRWSQWRWKPAILQSTTERWVHSGLVSLDLVYYCKMEFI